MINDFFNSIAEITKLIKKQNPDLGFNAFSLMSDIYMRENFHSDMIQAILSPESKHGGGLQFYRFFLNLLKENTQSDDLRNALEELRAEEPIQVTREEGRTDIAIYSKDWAMIVENKINNADDRDLQIPRYLEYWREKQKKEVKAVVYLSADGSKQFPSRDGWAQCQIDDVKKLLIPLAGFCNQGNPDLYSWLKQCAAYTDSFYGKSVISQYSEIVKKQAGDIMEYETAQKFLENAAHCEVDISDLKFIIDSLPKFYAKYFSDELKNNDLFNNVYIHSETTTVLDNFCGQNNTVSYSMDIACAKLDTLGISFFVRENKTKEEEKALLDAFNKVLENYGFNYTDQWDGGNGKRYYRTAKKYPTINELTTIVENLKKFIQELK